MEVTWTYNADKDQWESSTGRTLYAHTDLLSVQDGNATLFYGFDGGHGSLDSIDLDHEERRALAEIMIERWKRWAEA